MPSNSAIKFNRRLNELLHLREIAIDVRIKPIQHQQKQVFLHSYLTGIVAAWDTYIKSIIKEYLSLITQPSDLRYNAIFSLLSKYALTSVDKLNTPNFENTRNILISTTGYDPINDSIWAIRNFNAIDTRERLNEILKVRHSFAHGFSMPSYSWNRSSSGQVRLTTIAVDDCKALLAFLVKQYDKGLRNNLRLVHGIDPGW